MKTSSIFYGSSRDDCFILGPAHPVRFLVLRCCFQQPIIIVWLVLCDNLEASWQWVGSSNFISTCPLKEATYIDAEYLPSLLENVKGLVFKLAGWHKNGLHLFLRISRLLEYPCSSSLRNTEPENTLQMRLWVTWLIWCNCISVIFSLNDTVGAHRALFITCFGISLVWTKVINKIWNLKCFLFRQIVNTTKLLLQYFKLSKVLVAKLENMLNVVLAT